MNSYDFKIDQLIKQLHSYTVQPQIFFIDLFCGAGGVTEGVERFEIDGYNPCHVIACVNHDTNAINSHAANHPSAIHFLEDIRTLDISPLKVLVARIRKEFPDGKFYLWASLDCTNHSKAKGGLPKNADSRTLAWELYRYIEELKPDMVWIENVREFMRWGPIDEDGFVIKENEGDYYDQWIKDTCAYGYEYDYRILNCADFGCHTSRIRYFAQFATPDLDMVWPEPTHDKKGRDGLQKWLPVREILELEEHGQSIFSRKKPLVENTLKRIYAGLIKFIAGGDKAFIKRYNGGDPKNKVHSLDTANGTISTNNRHALVTSEFLQKYHGTGKNILDSNDPSSSLTTKDRLALVTATQFMTRYYSSGTPTASLDQPGDTITSIPKTRLITAKEANQFIDQQYGNSKPVSLDDSVNTITANPKFNLVSSKFLKDKIDLVNPQFLMDTNFRNNAKSIEDPAPTITASHKHHYLINPQYKNKGSSVSDPCFTLIARMDKMPPYLATAEKGEGFIIIYPDDSEMTIKIKEFMALYGITDICMRMLFIKELKKIQGFNEEYTLIGTKTEAKKYIGNSVPPGMVTALIQSNYRYLNSKQYALAI